MYRNNIIHGYDTNPPCNTGTPCFKPDNPTTRGQMAKIVTLAFGFAIDTTGGPHFQDVAVGSTYYDYVETTFNLRPSIRLRVWRPRRAVRSWQQAVLSPQRQRHTRPDRQDSGICRHPS